MSVTTTPTAATTDARAAGPVIVVGYDGSPEAKLAVSVAGERAGPDGIVVPVRVVPLPQADMGGPLHAPPYDRAAKREERLLADMTAIDTGFATVEPGLVDGDPVTELVRIARERNAREIVVGSRGRGRIRSLLGSVSHGVLGKADRPVVIVPRAAVAEDA